MTSPGLAQPNALRRAHLWIDSLPPAQSRARADAVCGLEVQAVRSASPLLSSFHRAFDAVPAASPRRPYGFTPASARRRRRSSWHAQQGPLPVRSRARRGCQLGASARGGAARQPGAPDRADDSSGAVLTWAPAHPAQACEPAPADAPRSVAAGAVARPQGPREGARLAGGVGTLRSFSSRTTRALF